jgi:hypothetical protein
VPREAEKGSGKGLPEVKNLPGPDSEIHAQSPLHLLQHHTFCSIIKLLEHPITSGMRYGVHVTRNPETKPQNQNTLSSGHKRIYLISLLFGAGSLLRCF